MPSNNKPEAVPVEKPKEEEPVEYIFKVLIIGDVATGKTSLTRSYVQNVFRESYKPTVSLIFY